MQPNRWLASRFSRGTAVAAALGFVGAGIIVVPRTELPERQSAWLLIENVDGQPERWVVPGIPPQQLTWLKGPTCDELPPSDTFIDQMENGCLTARMLPCDEGFQTAWTRGALAQNYLTCIAETLNREIGREPSFTFEIGLAWVEAKNFGRAFAAIAWSFAIVLSVALAISGVAFAGRVVFRWVQSGAQGDDLSN